MYRLFNTSKSGMIANQNKLEILSNNISNVNTTGYKKLDTQFSDLLSQTLNIRAYPTNSPDSQKGTGVKLSNPIRNLEQGALKQTGLKTDLGIDGDGFFRVTNKDGNSLYSRNGNFSIDAFGKIVDSNGHILEIEFEQGINYDNAGINNENLKVSKDGQVRANDKLIGNIKLYEPSGNTTFTSNGDNTFAINNGGYIVESKNISIIQGSAEMSNVSLQDEIVELIKTQRAFQLNSKGVRVADEMWSIANNLKSR